MKIITILFLLFAFAGITRGQIINPGFENWAIDSTNGLLSPVGWTDMTTTSVPSIEQAPGRMLSPYCARIVNIYDSSNGQIRGGKMIMEGVPVNAVPSSISGYWQNGGTIDPFEALYIHSYIVDSANQIVSSFSTTVGQGNGVNQPFWTAFTKNYPSAGSIGATLFLDFQHVVNPNTLNNYSELDDLSLSFPASINDFENFLTSSQIYPSISTGEITLSLTVTRMAKFNISVRDLSGKEMAAEQVIKLAFGNNKIPLKFDLSNGIYFMVLQCERGEKTLKFMIAN